MAINQIAIRNSQGNFENLFPLAIAKGGTGATSLFGQSGLLGDLHPVSADVPEYFATFKSNWSGGTYTSKQALLKMIYPVGAVYISYNSTSPATLFGGSWTAITGRFPYFNNSTATGGSNTATHRHWMPVGKENGASGFSTTAINGWSDGAKYSLRAADVNHSIYTEDMYILGGSGKGNATEVTTYNETLSTMPAYQSFYAWRRTA